MAVSWMRNDAELKETLDSTYQLDAERATDFFDRYFLEGGLRKALNFEKC